MAECFGLEAAASPKQQGWLSEGLFNVSEVSKVHCIWIRSRRHGIEEMA